MWRLPSFYHSSPTISSTCQELVASHRLSRRLLGASISATNNLILVFHQTPDLSKSSHKSEPFQPYFCLRSISGGDCNMSAAPRWLAIEMQPAGPVSAAAGLTEDTDKLTLWEKPPVTATSWSSPLDVTSRPVFVRSADWNRQPQEKAGWVWVCHSACGRVIRFQCPYHFYGVLRLRGKKIILTNNY